jgi:hypothetical protein
MRHDSYAGMLKHIVDTVVVGRDTVLASDDPVARTIGFTVSSPRGAEEHFVTLTASQEDMEDYQRSLLASGQKGRKKMAALMAAGVPKHGHGFRRSRDCPLCLASDVMES